MKVSTVLSKLMYMLRFSRQSNIEKCERKIKVRRTDRHHGTIGSWKVHPSEHFDWIQVS